MRRIEFGDRTPGDRLALHAAGIAPESRDVPDFQSHVLVGVGVIDLDQRGGTLDADVELLVKLPAKRVETALFRVDLATRKLPQSALVQVCMAMRDEYLAGGIADHADRDAHGRGRGRGTDAQLRYSALMRT